MDRLNKRYAKQPATAEHVVLLCNRCVKFYNLVEHVGLMYKLIRRAHNYKPGDLAEIERDLRLFKRSMTTSNWIRWNATFISLG